MGASAIRRLIATKTFCCCFSQMSNLLRLHTCLNAWVCSGRVGTTLAKWLTNPNSHSKAFFPPFLPFLALLLRLSVQVWYCRHSAQVLNPMLSCAKTRFSWFKVMPVSEHLSSTCKSFLLFAFSYVWGVNQYIVYVYLDSWNIGYGFTHQNVEQFWRVTNPMASLRYWNFPKEVTNDGSFEEASSKQPWWKSCIVSTLLKHWEPETLENISAGVELML